MNSVRSVLLFHYGRHDTYPRSYPPPLFRRDEPPPASEPIGNAESTPRVGPCNHPERIIPSVRTSIFKSREILPAARAYRSRSESFFLPCSANDCSGRTDVSMDGPVTFGPAVPFFSPLLVPSSFLYEHLLSVIGYSSLRGTFRINSRKNGTPLGKKLPDCCELSSILEHVYRNVCFISRSQFHGIQGSRRTQGQLKVQNNLRERRVRVTGKLALQLHGPLCRPIEFFKTTWQLRRTPVDFRPGESLTVVEPARDSSLP